MLVYKPGRKFVGILMPKGKGSDKRAPKPYLREQRKPVLVAGKVVMQPVSRQKIEKFLKEQCEELKDFIVETDESRFLGHVHKEKKVEEVKEKVEEEELEDMVEEEIEDMVEEEIEEIEEIEDEVMEEDFEIMDISDDAWIPEDDEN